MSAASVGVSKNGLQGARRSIALAAAPVAVFLACVALIETVALDLNSVSRAAGPALGLVAVAVATLPILVGGDRGVTSSAPSVAALALAGGLGIVQLSTLPFYFAPATRAIVLAVVTTALMGLLAIDAVMGRVESSRLSPVDAAYATVVVITVLSFFVHAPDTAAFHRGYTTVAMFSIYCFARFAFERRLRPGLWPMISLLVAIGWLEALRGGIQSLAHVRVHGLFWNPNFLAMYLAACFPLAISLLSRKGQSVGARGIHAAACASIVGGVFLTGCRAALIGLVFSLLPEAWARYRSRLSGMLAGRSRVPALLVGGATLALAVGSGVSLFLLKPVSAIGRILVWRISWTMHVDHPLFGVGPDGFARLFSSYQAAFFRRGLGSEAERHAASFVYYAFNDYLQRLVELGWTGFVVLVCFWFLIGKNVLEVTSARGADENPTLPLRGMAGTVVGVMVMSLINIPGEVVPLQYLFTICLACIVSANLRAHVG